MYLNCTLSTNWRRAFVTNPTDSSYPSTASTATEPTGDGIHNAGFGGIKAQNGIVVMPFGIGDDDDVFNMRAWGWTRLGDNPETSIWIPMLLADFVCTMSTSTGVANKLLLSTERLCDTITLTTGNDDVSIDIVSPTGNVPAHAVLDLKGSQKVTFTFDQHTGSPTSFNTLFRFV